MTTETTGRVTSMVSTTVGPWLGVHDTDLVYAARRDALHAARRHVDRWARDLLGEYAYESGAWAGILRRRARAELVYAAEHQLQDHPGVFHVTLPAEDALLAEWAETVARRHLPPSTLYGVPINVAMGPVDWYATPGRAWTWRHVSQQYLEAAGGGQIGQELGRLIDDWCTSQGLQRVEPVDLEWRKAADDDRFGVVSEVTARANTRHLPGVFLG